MACRSHTGGQKYCTLPFPWGPVRAAAVPCSRRRHRLSGHFFRPSGAGRARGTGRPASHTMGSRAAARKKRERSKKLASGAAASPCRFRDFVPMGRVFLGGVCRPGLRLQERVCPPLSRTARPCPSAPGASRQQAARHRKRAPEDRGPCRRWSVRPLGLGRAC